MFTWLISSEGSGSQGDVPGDYFQHADDAGPVTTPRPRVLVVDDEPRIRLALRACLESDGYEVDEAGTGMEAMDLIISRAPAVMILDLAMPDVDGLQTLAHIEGVHGQLKPRTIVLTAWGSPPIAARAIGLGAAAFVEKPIAPADLRRIVRRVLNESTEEDARFGIPIDWPAEDNEPDEPARNMGIGPSASPRRPEAGPVFGRPVARPFRRASNENGATQ